MSTPKLSRPRTVQRLLEATAHPAQQMADNGRVQVYRFPDNVPELAPYVLRVQTPDGKLKQALQHSTALTPVHALVQAMHIGQPLMQLDGATVSIHLQQHGTSLHGLKQELMHRYRDTGCAQIHASLALMEQVFAMAETTGKNPFVPLLDVAYKLEKRGIEPDFTSGNILLSHDGRQLQLVDQLEMQINDAHYTSSLRAPAMELQNIFDISVAPPADLEARFTAHTERLSQMLQEAVGIIHRRYRENPQEARFASVNDVHAVALSHPPQQLVLALRDLQNKAQLPSR